MLTNPADANSTRRTVSLFYYNGLFDVIPKRLPCSTWEELSANLEVFEETDSKESVKLWNAALLSGSRSSANVLGVDLAIYDLDKNPDRSPLTPDQVNALFQRLGTSGVEYIAYTTHSHKPEAPRYRVVFNLSRTVPTSQWLAVWTAIADKFGLPKDEKAKDPSRVYFLPSCPGGRLDDTEVRAGGAHPLDVDALLKERRAEALATIPAAPLDVDALRKTLPMLFSATRWKRLAELAYYGHPLATAGERNDTVHSFISALFERIDGLTAPACFGLIIRSVDAMRAEGFTDDVYAMVVKAEARALERRAEKAAQEAANKAFGAELLAAQPKPKGPYTHEELERWRKELGFDTVDDLVKHLLIEHNGAYYVFANGKYGPPKGKQSLLSALNDDFERCPDYLWTTNAKGESRPAKIDDIIRNHSRSANEVIYTYVAQTSRFDRETKTLHRAICPVRKITPKRNDEIQTWLELLDPTGKVLDWVATATRLDKMTCALYLEGGRNSGKSLLPTALSRLWTEGGPVPFKEIYGDFQGGLTKCPLIFADEDLPPALSGKSSPTTFLRRLLGSGRITINQKFQDLVTIVGCPRVVMGANNPSMLKTFESLTSEDLDATAERVLHVKIPDAAVEYLGSFDQPHNDAWITQDTLAAHALWLAETRKVVPAKRYLVEGTASGALDTLTISTDAAQAVCEWIVAYIMRRDGSPNGLVQKIPRGAVYVGGGEVLVSAPALQDGEVWGDFCPSRKFKMLHPVAVGRALSTLAHEEIRKATGGTQYRLQRVNLKLLLAWVEHAKSVKPEVLMAKINAPNPDVNRMQLAPVHVPPNAPRA